MNIYIICASNIHENFTWCVIELNSDRMNKKPSCRWIADRMPQSTFGGHVASSVHLIPQMSFLIGGLLEWSLSPTVFEILRSERIVVTSLTFQGHVTSSVIW